MKYRVRINDREYDVEVDGERIRVDGEEVTVGPGKIDGEIEVLIDGSPVRVRPVPAPSASTTSRDIVFLLGGKIVQGSIESSREALARRVRPLDTRHGPETLRSQIPGIIRQIFRSPGDEVQAGETILTLEAMKMENEVVTSLDGVVREILVEVGEVVAAGADLAVVVPTSSAEEEPRD